MKLGEILEFRKDLYFNGAVEADWFYDPERADKVAVNYVFHGREYYGIHDLVADNRLIDTISFTEKLGQKLHDPNANPLSLVIADYGTGKSHLAVTLGQLYSGRSYMPSTYDGIIENISKIDRNDGDHVRSLFDTRNFVIVINGMHDFNLNAELLKAVQKSFVNYGLPLEKLKKLNRSSQTASAFLKWNAQKNLYLFEKKAEKHGWYEKGNQLISKLSDLLVSDDTAFEIINDVYYEINGSAIQWGDGITATSILSMLVSEFCAPVGPYDKVIILFDEFGRYLEYASSIDSPVKSGEAALQDIFEATQDFGGKVQIVNFIQRDIKAYMNTIDNTKNIERYIGRYDASERFYLSSNLETVFANLIQRKNPDAFQQYVINWQNAHEDTWKSIFDMINSSLTAEGLWKDYDLFRKVIVEGTYPLHPMSTYMLAHLSDYLQNRSSLTMVRDYIERQADFDVSSDHQPFIYPETLMNGPLYEEMLAAEQTGRQKSQQCIKYDNILQKYDDKLTDNARTVLRANLVLRILRFKSNSLQKTNDALRGCTNLSLEEFRDAMKLLVDEYGCLTFDTYANCYDFPESANGAHDFRIFIKRLLSFTELDMSIFNDSRILKLGGFDTPQYTNYDIIKHINTAEWNFEQSLRYIGDFNANNATIMMEDWRNATDAEKPKGKLIWLYSNRDVPFETLNNVQIVAKQFRNAPIYIMLLDDRENHLYSALLEYQILHGLSEENKGRFGYHYQQEVRRTEDQIKDEFQVLKLERRYIGEDGVNQFDKRLANALTERFSEIYPDAVSFAFDAFITKSNKLSTKALGTLCNMVNFLVGHVSFDSLHDRNSEVRNRIQAVLIDGNAFSWKCILYNQEEQTAKLVPPMDPAAEKAYLCITNRLETDKAITCKKIFDMLSKEPYGMSKEAILLMLAVVAGNLFRHLEFKYSDKTYEPDVWCSVTVGDKKPDFDKILSTSINLVDVNAAVEAYEELVGEIEENTSIDNVETLSEKMVSVGEIYAEPESIKVRINNARSKLESGRRLKAEWGKALAIPRQLMDSAEQLTNFQSAVKALKAYETIAPEKIFPKDIGYRADETILAEYRNLGKRIEQYIDGHFHTYIRSLHCRSVDKMEEFKSSSMEISDILKNSQKADFYDYGKEINKVVNNELRDVEAIREKGELTAAADEMLQQTDDRTTSYERLVLDEKRASEILKRMSKYLQTMGFDWTNTYNMISEKAKTISKLRKRMEENIQDVDESVRNIGNTEDIRNAIDDINGVLQMGIKPDDSIRLQNEKNGMQELLEQLDEYRVLCRSRQDAKQGEENLVEQYKGDERFNFHTNVVIEDTYNDIIKKFDREEQDWKDRNLHFPDDSRRAVLEWREKNKTLPEYLSEETINEVKKMYLRSEEIISKGKIEDVYYYFQKLNPDEQKKCIEGLTMILNKNG
jgi:hypothetical protein